MDAPGGAAAHDEGAIGRVNGPSEQSWVTIKHDRAHIPPTDEQGPCRLARVEGVERGRTARRGGAFGARYHARGRWRHAAAGPPERSRGQRPALFSARPRSASSDAMISDAIPQIDSCDGRWSMPKADICRRRLSQGREARSERPPRRRDAGAADGLAIQADCPAVGACRGLRRGRRSVVFAAARFHRSARAISPVRISEI